MTGGISGDYLTNLCQYYLISANSWSFAPSLNYARADHSSCTLNEVVYVFCGRTTHGLVNNIESLDTRTHLYSLHQAFWFTIDVKNSNQWDLVSMRQNSLVVPINSNSIMIVGGHDPWARPKEKNDVFIFNVQTHMMIYQHPALNERDSEGLHCPGNQVFMSGTSEIVALVKSRAMMSVVTYKTADKSFRKLTRLI